MDFNKYRFTYNAMAFFNAQERYPDGLAQEVFKEGKEGLDALCWALEELSTQGDLVRRSLGYDKGEILTAEMARAQLKANDVPKAKLLVLDALKRGMGEVDEEDEVDLVLMELQKKTKTG